MNLFFFYLLKWIYYSFVFLQALPKNKKKVEHLSTITNSFLEKDNSTQKTNSVDSAEQLNLMDSASTASKKKIFGDLFQSEFSSQEQQLLSGGTLN